MISRRQFLAGVSLSIASPTISFSKEVDRNDKSLIFIWLGGGISDIDFINPLPLAPVEIRSSRGSQSTKTPGECVGGDFKSIAANSDKFTIVRSFHHKDSNHQSATYWTMTSEPNFNNKTDTWPSYGSFLVNQCGFSQNGIPLYIKTSSIEGDGAAWLGVGCDGYKADPKGIADLRPAVDRERLERRLDIVRSIEKKNDHLSQNWLELRNKAVDVTYGKVGRALDISGASDKEKGAYNVSSSQFGRDCLTAKRLVEAGSKFVTVSLNGWDMHSDIDMGFYNKAGELDSILCQLVNDIDLERTLVVVTSEFGRTYKINQTGGRDHKAACSSLLFAGGGFSHGRIVGKTDAIGSQVVEDDFTPKDLAFTIAQYFGFNTDLTMYDNLQRPRKMFEGKSIL